MILACRYNPETSVPNVEAFAVGLDPEGTGNSTLSLFYARLTIRGR